MAGIGSRTQLFVILALVFSLPLLAAQEDDRAAQIAEAKAAALAMKEEITAQCMADPYSCSCDGIPCEDILEAEDPRAQEAYDRCVQERNSCESQRQAGIEKMEEQRAKIEAECRKDIDACDCSSIESPEGRDECELAVIDAKYEAQKQKQEKISECIADLEGCSCDSIENEKGKVQCEEELKRGREMKERIEAACRENPVACDCSEIEIAEAKAACEAKKSEALGQIDSAIKGALSKCFRNVDECDCNGLGLPEEEYATFCEVQKGYGLDCKYKGYYCEKLEDTEIYPVGMPPWLGKYFAKEYSSYVEAEKEKATKGAAKIITRCINNPEECECNAVPEYATAFCERMKELQIRCYADDYDACTTLDTAPNLPEGMPYFMTGPLDTMIGKLRDARASASKGNAARKVGDMILLCMDDSSKCDCSIAPKGKIKAFCEHKKSLVKMCIEEKDYESCFTLDEEPVVSEDVPGFIRGYVEKNTVPKVNTKKNQIFNDMKQGTVCQDIETLEECKRVYRENKQGR